MKVRHGFVSNSSSSSFIVGLGKVVDKERLESEISKLDVYDFEIISVKDAKMADGWSERYKNGEYILESFMDYGAELDISNMEDEELIVKYSFCGHDDSDFMDGEDDWEMNYDKVYEDGFFNNSEECAMSLFGDESIIKDGVVVYGAGRNG